MEEIRKKVSPAQARAQKNYDLRTKTISVKYTPKDMEDYKAFKEYLDKTGQHANHIIKELIKDFLDPREDQIISLKAGDNVKLYDSIANDRVNEMHEYSPYIHICIVGRIIEKSDIIFMPRH